MSARDMAKITWLIFNGNVNMRVMDGDLFWSRLFEDTDLISLH